MYGFVALMVMIAWMLMAHYSGLELPDFDFMFKSALAATTLIWMGDVVSELKKIKKEIKNGKADL
jgi:hypothetical protein